MEIEEVTNQELLEAMKHLQKQIDHIREMIYETNAGYFDTAQIANIDNTSDKQIVPLTNRELLLTILKMYPVVDWKTGREKLVPSDDDEVYLEWRHDIEDEEDEIQ